MNSWDIATVELRAGSPQVLTTTEDARAIALELPAGGELKDHQVHERAWVTVVDGEVEFTTAAGDRVAGGCGLMVEFAPGERHAVQARTRARLLLLLTPWPGKGHPATMPSGDAVPEADPAAARAGE